ncbi:MAG: ATP-binding cassette domain-containing protein [Saprospiraceae bacterium]
MDLSIQKLSKAFNQKQIFQDLTFDVKEGSRFAITGSNGSGKSTLLKILSGGMLPSSGMIHYVIDGNEIPDQEVFRHVHFVAPYNSVIEELTMKELFQLHKRLGLLSGFSNFKEWFMLLEYSFNPDQPIKSYSSGMKQRVKLGLTMPDDRPLILLDEPTSNLDAQGKTWFFKLIDQVSFAKTIIIASNEEAEIRFCTESINLEQMTVYQSR